MPRGEGGVKLWDALIVSFVEFKEVILNTKLIIAGIDFERLQESTDYPRMTIRCFTPHELQYQFGDDADKHIIEVEIKRVDQPRGICREHKRKISGPYPSMPLFINFPAATTRKGGNIMVFTPEQQAEFEKVTRPIMKFLNDNCHPHVSVIVTPIFAELLDGVCSTGVILDYLKD